MHPSTIGRTGPYQVKRTEGFLHALTLLGLSGLMFIREGPLTGLICKFAIYVLSAFPLMGKPTIKISAPSNFDHPLVNKHDQKVIMPEWNPDEDTLLTIINFIRNLFVSYEPSRKINPEEYVKSSVQQIFESTEKDLFYCPKWTPEVLQTKNKIITHTWEWEKKEAEESVPPTEVTSS